MASWVCYAVPSEDESYIGIPDKLLNECTDLMENTLGDLPLTFRVKFNDREAYIGMTEFVQGNNLYLPTHIMKLLQAKQTDKVKLSSFRRKPPVLKQIHLKPLDWEFYDEGNHTHWIESSLRFFPTMNKDAILPVKFGNRIVHLQVVKLISTEDTEVPYTLIRQEEIRLEFESNDDLYKQYEQKLRERTHIAKMDSWNRAWEYIQRGRPVFGMSDELRKFIREKSIMNKIVK